MQCFQNILIPINLHDPSRAALLTQALPLCSKNANVHLLHVSTPEPLIPFDDALGTMPVYKEANGPSDKEFENLLSELEVQGKFQYSISYGEVREEVAKYVQENHIDLIITAHHRHSTLYQIFFHSTDEKIIENVDIPVLVLPSS